MAAIAVSVSVCFVASVVGKSVAASVTKGPTATGVALLNGQGTSKSSFRRLRCGARRLPFACAFPCCVLRAKGGVGLTKPQNRRLDDERLRPSADPLELVLFGAARRRRPRNRPRDRTRTRPPARRDRAHRLGKHRLPRRARGARVGHDQQIRRRLSGPALLRRMPVSSTSRRRWRSSAPASCSTAASPTSSPIPAARRIRACSWR